MPNAARNPEPLPFTLVPLEGGFGARIDGLPIPAIDDATFPAVYAAFLKHQFLLFRDQDLPPGAQVAFARHFGEVQIHVMNQYHANAHPELYTLSNLGPDGKPSGRHPDRGTMAWHTDGSWQRRSTKCTMLFAEIMPRTGGNTGFADMYSAFDALSPGEQRRLEAMRVLHNLDFSRNRRHAEDPMTDAQRKAVPPVEQPLVRVHPETGRKAMYLGDHAESVVGMGYDEGRIFIDGLNERIVADCRTYFHDWRPHDFIVWDNRCLMHKAGSYDTANEPRVIRRCTVLGDAA
ncbi:MAG: TauD/TfdA family dioxygenase [Proteobacteria bacterium]|nr:TauD/TfdA family dioxygenase [Pseudomonadota bacterium]